MTNSLGSGNGPHVVEVSKVEFSFRTYMCAECSTCGWYVESESADESSRTFTVNAARKHVEGS